MRDCSARDSCVPELKIQELLRPVLTPKALSLNTLHILLTPVNPLLTHKPLKLNHVTDVNPFPTSYHIHVFTFVFSARSHPKQSPRRNFIPLKTFAPAEACAFLVGILTLEFHARLVSILDQSFPRIPQQKHTFLIRKPLRFPLHSLYTKYV